MTKYLFDYKTDILKKIEQSSQVYLFLDYDGTLVPFKRLPNQVSTPERIIEILNHLRDKSNIELFIITGRSLDDIKRLVGISGVNYAAVHGIQIELTSGEKIFWEKADRTRSLLNKIKKASHESFNDINGLFIEDKKYSLAVHYRGVLEKKHEYVIKVFEEIVKQYKNEDLELLHGAKLLEVRPGGWNKGKAIELILKKTDAYNNPLLVYLGDDTTDEDAFKFLKQNNSVTVFVVNDSQINTQAGYWVKNPNQVINFLKNIS